MQFELNSVLIDEIIFYMENQDGDFILDSHKLRIIDILNGDSDEDTDFDDNERFISIPKWEPKDGYRLMEKFAAGLKNPVLRHELGEALNRNKGVFRAFRNVLSQYPEAEKMWQNCKEQKMKGDVIAWYNALREEWGLLPIGSEPEDNSSLVLEDFLFKDEGEFFIKAYSANGEEAGGIRAEKTDSNLHIFKMEVKPEYRGLGIGKALIAKLLKNADDQKLNVTIDLPAETDFFTRSLLLENFKLFSQRFLRKVN